MIRTFPDPALVTRAVRVAVEELTGSDPGVESSGYVEGHSDHARQEELKAVAARANLLRLPGRLEVGPPIVVETEGGVTYVKGGQYSMLRDWRDRVSLKNEKLKIFKRSFI